MIYITLSSVFQLGMMTGHSAVLFNQVPVRFYAIFLEFFYAVKNFLFKFSGHPAMLF